MPKRPEVSPAPRQSLMLERKAQVTGTLRTEDCGTPAGTSEGPGNVQAQGSAASERTTLSRTWVSGAPPTPSPGWLRSAGSSQGSAMMQNASAAIRAVTLRVKASGLSMSGTGLSLCPRSGWAGQKEGRDARACPHGAQLICLLELSLRGPRMQAKKGNDIHSLR